MLLFKKNDLKLYVTWFFLAFSTRVVVQFVTYFWSTVSGKDGFYPLSSGADDRYYFQQATLIALGHGVDWSSLPNVYPVFLGWLYRLSDPVLFLGQSFNTIVGALTVVVGVATAKKIASRSTRSMQDLRHPVNLAGLLLTVYPAHMFYSTQLLKDPILNFLGMTAIYLATSAFTKQDRRSWMFWLLWVVDIIALYFWRGYTAYALVVATVFLWFVRAKVARHIKAGLLLFAVAALAFVPYVFGYGLFASDALMAFSAHIAEFRQEVYSIGGSAVGIVLDPKQPMAFVIGWFYSFITVWLGPFPWQIHSAVQLIAFPEAMMMWALLPFILRRVKELYANPRDPAQFLLWFSIILMAGIGLFSDNIGANTRLRLLPWMSIMIFAAAGMQKQRGRHQVENPLPHHPQRAGWGPGTCAGFDSRLPGSRGNSGRSWG